MRFVTYSGEGEDRVGVLDGDQVHALPRGVRLLDLLDHPAKLREAGEQALRRPHDVRELSDLRLRAPIPAPPTVRDFMTFERHIEGMVKLAGPDAVVPDRWYQAPAFYFTNPYAIQGPHDEVRMPPGSRLFDFELEVAAVIGRSGRNIPLDRAEEHIAGYTLMNDWSARDLQFAELGVMLGPVKAKDTVTTLGPVLVTPDELAPYRKDRSFALRMTAMVNGELIGEDLLSNMSFGYPQMIAYASRGTDVRTGDVLGSGTSGGGCLAELWGRQGFRARPPLRPGDVVTIGVEQLGTQTCRVAPAEEAPTDDLTAGSRRARSGTGARPIRPDGAGPEPGPA
ncbi:fumarylacetoacetate hydrolase family protein (plasmid) [Streptomyces sp. BI20]|uniref:fumarylacetoacetate hydrolase family protein n=1 Tax=Streptomyces sp. BI20 TaxID=3403460 RepID=UPI003C759619